MSTNLHHTHPDLWHSRGFLPRFDKPGAIQAITFRLHDSVPFDLIDRWREEIRGMEICDNEAAAELRLRISKYEDAGHGECWLKSPEIAQLVQDALLHSDNQRYRLLTWCIMPNHVHVLIEGWDRWPLADIVQSWKSFTAKEANRLLNRTGIFWFREYHDRFIRDETHFANAVEYIHQNPVRAGLANSPQEWPHSRISGAAGVPPALLITPDEVGQRSDAGRRPAVPGGFPDTLKQYGLTLRRRKTEILQINTGKLCNLTCMHCHVNAGPKRKEIITRPVIDRILEWLETTDIHTVDLTGGAPEMIPDFRYFIEKLRALPQVKTIIDRCNLTILVEPGYEDMAQFLAKHRITIIASMPCYEPANVNAQRGEGVFDASIRGLQLLNQLGYGRNPTLQLDLVYNPNGAFLPPDQEELEADYKRELKAHFDIDFDRLFTITNMPIARYKSWLKNNGKLDDYMTLLRNSFNPSAVNGLMCRDTLSIGWMGEVFDCDFNQQLGMQWKNGKPLFLWDIDSTRLENREIAMGDHCFGCTAGRGSSCQGTVA